MEDAARTKENEEKIMSTPAPAPAPANVNIETTDYFRRRIISKLEATCLWSVGYFGIYLIGMIFILHKNWARVIIITIPLLLVFFLNFWVAISKTWEEVKSFLMISTPTINPNQIQSAAASTGGSTNTNRTSMKEVYHGIAYVFRCSLPYIVIHFYIVVVTSTSQAAIKEVGLSGLLYGCAAVFVLLVLTVWNAAKVTEDLIAFERRLQSTTITHHHNVVADQTIQQQQSSAIGYRRASYCKCTMPPNASASDIEWIKYYILAD